MDCVHVDGSGTDADHEKSFSMKKQHACSVTRIGTIHELVNALHDTLQVKDENLESGSNLHSDDGKSSCLESENTGSGDCNSDLEVSIASKCLHKRATFPKVVKEDSLPESQQENKHRKYSQSHLTAKKLISAMKGGREKEGVPSRKLSVSWAPDVYDPPPTSLSHYPRRKSRVQFKSNKKHGKGKQKGKNTSTHGGGSGPKNKKQYRNMGGRSDRCLDTFGNSDGVISSNRFAAIDLLDLDDGIDIGSSDTNCASNFMEQAGGTMHYVC